MKKIICILSAIAFMISQAVLSYADDINLEGLDMTKEDLEKILDVDKAAWEEEFKGVEELYAKFGDTLPEELRTELETVKSNL